MKRLFSVLAVIMVLVFSANVCLAANVVQPGDDFYYLDTANVLSEATKGEIYFCNTDLYDACGAQICIVALDTIGGGSTEDYAYELANSWGIGSAEEENGFLLLMAIQEDDYYAICGSGIRDIFPASVIKDYYDKYLETDFAAKNYDAGAKKFFEAVFNKIVDRYGLDLTVEQGIAKYQEFAAGNQPAQSTKDSRPSGRTDTTGKNTLPGGSTRNSTVPVNSNDGEDAFTIMIGGIILMTVLLVVVLRVLTRGRRSGGVYFWGPRYRAPRPPMGGSFGGPTPRGGSFGGPTPRGPGFGSRPSGGSSFSSRPSGGSSFSSRSSSGSSFGGGRSGGGSFGSSRSSGGFGGGRSGGGGGFGGGAGRGRR